MPARILIIEDDAENLDLIEYLRAAFGHATLSAGEGEDGLAREIAERPDLIVVPTVAVTASAMIGDRGRVLKAGFDGYLTKPINPETFVGQIEAFSGAGIY